LPSLHINEQARHLLARPLALQQVVGISTVIVIDALDELSENEDEEQGLVSLLVSFSNRLDALTDETFKLHCMEQSNVSRDIRSFYESLFRQLIASRRLQLTDWPSSDDLTILTDRTGSLFVYRATIIKFVGTPSRFNTLQRLRSILDFRHSSSQHYVLFQTTDLLYTQIIHAVVMVDNVIDEHRMYKML
jgi:hypothetical protein